MAFVDADKEHSVEITDPGEDVDVNPSMLITENRTRKAFPEQKPEVVSDSGSIIEHSSALLAPRKLSLGAPEQTFGQLDF